jgi:hypothetical protein
MKKFIGFLLSILVFSFTLNSQNVDSIKVEQSGDLIKIRYKILNSNSNQTFRVSVTCAVNGGLQSIPKSLSGDFGENVVGGRDEYMVLWDVLKDVDEVNSVDFSVKAELMKGSIENAGTKQQIHVLGVVEGPGPQLGVRLGYMGSWGFSTMVTGSSNFINGSLDLTKRVVNAKKIQIALICRSWICNRSK